MDPTSMDGLQPDWWQRPPVTLAECIVQWQMLMQRVSDLENQVASLKASQPLGQLRKVEYKIGRLYVQDLSGTLNIGITSIGDKTQLTDLSDLPIHWTGEELAPFDDDLLWPGGDEDSPPPEGT